MGVLDGSLIEAHAYSEGILEDYTMDRIRDRLLDYGDHSVAYVIPPTIPLENDGLRHNDKEFRIVIHERIMQVIEAFRIPYHLLTSQTVEGRADEVLHTHKTLYHFQ